MDAKGLPLCCVCLEPASADISLVLGCCCRHLPLARDLVRVARQRLVFRLDTYCKRDKQLFSDVIKCALSWRCAGGGMHAERAAASACELGNRIPASSRLTAAPAAL